MIQQCQKQSIPITGNAANLHLDPRPGGCFCETLPDGGGHLHMMVVDVRPGKSMRLTGALGPLQNDALTGTLTWTIKPADQGVTLIQTYIVGGYFLDTLGTPDNGRILVYKLGGGATLAKPALNAIPKLMNCAFGT